MVITSKFIPQLFAYEDEEAKRILRNLKKVEIKNEYRLVDTGVREYVSVPKLDQKAFRYIEKNGKLYLRESVYSVGGLVQDSVLINLGDFTIGDDETGADLEYLVRVKDAKAKQRARQMRECERIAQATLQKIQKQIKNDELLKSWQNELNEARRFVRLGKEDYYQAQIDIIAKFAKQDENLAKILVDYNQKINAKNEKWLTQPLRLPKVKNSATRIGTELHAGIGELDPARRADFEQYYAVRAPQMTPYLQSENEISTELPAAPTIITDKQANATQAVVTTELTTPKVKTVTAGLQQMKQAFRTRSLTKSNQKETVSAFDATDKATTFVKPSAQSMKQTSSIIDDATELSH